MEDGQDKTDRELARLREYLSHSPGSNTDAIRIAMNHGESDSVVFRKRTEACVREPECQTASDACIEQCSRGELKDRIKSCDDLGWLPP